MIKVSERLKFDLVEEYEIFKEIKEDLSMMTDIDLSYDEFCVRLIENFGDENYDLNNSKDRIKIYNHLFRSIIKVGTDELEKRGEHEQSKEINESYELFKIN